MTRRCTLVLTAGLASLEASARQAPHGAQPPRFRVSTDVVQIDAVVTDRDGRIVPDLTAETFKVFQDGTRQRVTFAQFVPVLSHFAAAGAPACCSERGAPTVRAWRGMTSDVEIVPCG